MFPLVSIFVTGRPSSRLPQFPNNFTSHIENGPRLAFESQEFQQKSAFLDQSLVPALIVFAISISTAFAGALRTATLAVLQ